MDSILDYLHQRIQREGPLRFRDYMAEVLYHPELGYYSSLRDPIGTEGDYYTSANLDPVFGKLLAKRFNKMAEEFDSFTLVELGAGKGLLARDILTHTDFPYLILERSAAMRQRQRELLAGFPVKWIEELPRGITGCIFSNEFFDSLPVHRVVRQRGVLKEIYVTDGFREIEGKLTEAIESVAVPIEEGQFAEINMEACVWINRIAESLNRGYHLAVDYGYLRNEFFAQPYGTLMCYWKHYAIEDPYVRIGQQDITAHVNFSDLIDEGEKEGLHTVGFQSQTDFLVELGILDEMQRLACAADAASLQRLLRMKRLILPGSMGDRFKVLTQRKAAVSARRP